MLGNIHFTKAWVLVSILVLISIFTFNKIIENNRLEVFRRHSNIILPPIYKIKQNTAGTGNYSTDVLLVFGFDKKNYKLFLNLNNINTVAATHTSAGNWLNNGQNLFRKRNIDSHTIISEVVDPKQQTLKFRYQKE